MNAPNDNTAPKGLRVVAISAATRLQRLINPWEYRHLRAFGLTRIAGGSVAGAAGVICLSYGVKGWAAFFLIIGALNLAGGSWYITSIAPHRPEPRGTPRRPLRTGLCPGRTRR